MEIDGHSGDADIAEAESELFADASGVLGIPKAVLAAWEAVEPGAVTRKELLLGGGRHGDDGGRAGVGHLGRQLSARED